MEPEEKTRELVNNNDGRTRPELRVALWAAAALAATAVATVAITASVGGSGTTLTEDEVRQALLGSASTGAGTTGAGTTGAPTSSVTSTSGVPMGNGTVFRTTPGTVVVSCAGDLAALVSWSPNPGYRVDDVVRGPTAKASVWFESDVADDVLVVLTCAGGVATAQELPESDDHGGGRGGGGRGGDDGDEDRSGSNSGPG